MNAEQKEKIERRGEGKAVHEEAFERIQPGKGRRKHGSQTGKQEQSAQNQDALVSPEEAQEGAEEENRKYQSDQNKDDTDPDVINRKRRQGSKAHVCSQGNKQKNHIELEHEASSHHPSPP